MLLGKGSDHPAISILICSRDRRSDLATIVKDLKTMKTRYLFDMVVVEETNDPAPIEGVHYFPHPMKNHGFPYARNLSVAKSTGQIVVFIDDDCRIRDLWLDNLLKPFEDETVVGVQGGVVVPEGTNAIGWAESLLGFPGGGVKRIIASGGSLQETIEISTVNSAYRRWVVEAVGGFDGRLKLGGEDYLLAKKACRHGKCLFAPDALVTHRVRGNLVHIWHWFVRRGRAEIDVVRTREYERAGWGTVLRGSLTAKFVLISFLGLLLSGGWIYVIPVALALYLGLQYCRIFSIWRKSGASVKTLLIVPVVKLMMDVAMDAGRVQGIFRG